MRQEYSGEEVTLIDESATMLVVALEQDHRVAFLHKAANASDADLGKRLGVSRPTAAKRKQECMSILRAELSTVEDRLHEAIVAEVLLRILENRIDG